MSLITDDSTAASHPGEIIIAADKYLDYRGIKGMGRIYYSLLFRVSDDLLFRRFKHNQVVFDWLLKKEHFKNGCVNPSVVINKDTGLLATFTNLTSTGLHPTPVIKIAAEKLYLVKNISINNGQRLATVALYKRGEDPDAKAWINFDPKLPNCFTDNTDTCNWAIRRISKNAWKCLELGLDQISTKDQPGLYHVDLDSNLVNKAY